MKLATKSNQLVSDKAKTKIHKILTAVLCEYAAWSLTVRL